MAFSLYFSIIIFIRLLQVVDEISPALDVASMLYFLEWLHFFVRQCEEPRLDVVVLNLYVPDHYLVESDSSKLFASLFPRTSSSTECRSLSTSRAAACCFAAGCGCVGFRKRIGSSQLASSILPEERHP